MNGMNISAKSARQYKNKGTVQALMVPQKNF